MAIPEKQGNAPATNKSVLIARQVAMAMELPLVFVCSILAGGLLGYGVDSWLHTRPFGLLVGGVLGFGTGVRELLRRIPKSAA